MNALEVRNVCKKIKKNIILDNVSFEVPEGQIFGFIGPNGAGKSTMIKTMLGLYKKNSGTILINGCNIGTDFEAALKSVGAIIENPDMYSHLTGMQNLHIFRDMRGNLKDDKIMEYVKLVKLENRINDKVKTYSLGMKQRLGLVQALMHNPKLLVLDEPTNGLDPLGIIDLREILKKINKEYKTTIFISSHILSEIENICTTIAIIDNGKIIDTKTIADIRKELQNRYLIETNNNEYARNIIEKEFNITSVIDGLFIAINIGKNNIPSIIKILLQNNVDIYQIKSETKSLETEFIEKTIGSYNQIR